MIGIDISDKSIKVAQVTDDLTPELKAVSWGALSSAAVQRGRIQDPGLVAQQLQEVFERATPEPVEGKTVVASIPEVQSFVSIVEVPQMSTREMDEAVQWAVREHIPFDLERVYLDWQPLMITPEGKMRALVGAAQREVADPLLQVLDGMDLNVVGLELEGQSIVRSLLPLDPTGVNGVLIADLGASSSNVILFDQGAMRFTTSLPQGGDNLTTDLSTALQISFEEAAEKKALVGVSVQAQDQTVAAVLRASAKAMIEKIGQVARDISRQSAGAHAVQAVLLAGGGANLPGIVEVFAEVFPSIPVQLGNPWTNLLGEGKEGGAPMSTADATHFATALGLALRRPEDEYV